MIRIVEIGEIAEQGVTEPVFCKGDDGCEYVVKGRNAGFHSLIAEWVAGRLGRLMGLPIPEIARMEIVPEMFDYGSDADKLSKLGRGTLFGSRRVPNTVEIRDADVHGLDLQLQARVLAFDWWIANADRIFVQGRGNPNLLLAEDTGSLVVIDHNNAFILEDPGDFWMHHAFRDAKSIWTEAFRQRQSREFRAALQHLEVIWNELPEEWTESENSLSRSHVESILWKFDTEAAKFWNPP